MSKRSVRKPLPEEHPFPARAYILINAAFYLFCVLIFWMAVIFLKGQVTGLVPVLLAVCLCFTAVTMYDALFDRILFRFRQREIERERLRMEEKRKAESRNNESTGAGPLTPSQSGGESHPKGNR